MRLIYLKIIYPLTDLLEQQDKVNFNAVERTSAAKQGRLATNRLELSHTVQERKLIRAFLSGNCNQHSYI
jgi:hypothetical protein